jgi:hypothetical protein
VRQELDYIVSLKEGLNKQENAAREKMAARDADVWTFAKKVIYYLHIMK